MNESIRNPKLIVRNGIYLASRFFLSMLLSFYISRLMLSVLGDVDFGINNVIGGLIAMFAIISMPITNSLQRYFNVEFAKGNIEESVVFSTALRLVFYLVVVMLISYETIGLYVVSNILDYPSERTIAVQWTYQITALITLFSFINIPFSALLYSKEIMGVPATAELMGSVLKLLMLVLLPFVSGDMLILFTGSLLIISFIQFCILYFSASVKCSNIKITKRWDKSLQKSMLCFSGWNSIESLAGICITYLSNLLINIFGGILYNTANGLSKSITSAISSFTINVVKAAEPQITSSTVVKNDSYRDELVMLSIKLAFCFTGYIAIFFQYDGMAFLRIWLGNVPNYAFDFCRVMVYSCIFSSIILPLRSMIIATGQIKSYFTAYGIISIMSLLLMYALLKLQWPIITAVYIVAFSSVLNSINAVYTACRVTSFRLTIFINEMLRGIAVAGVVFCVYLASKYFLDNAITDVCLRLVLSGITMFVTFVFIGLNTKEKMLMLNKVQLIINKLRDI